MGKENTTFGSIHIAPNAVATIAYHATLQSYGVVGLAPRSLAEGLAHSITREPTRGIAVRFDGFVDWAPGISAEASHKAGGATMRVGLWRSPGPSRSMTRVTPR